MSQKDQDILHKIKRYHERQLEINDDPKLPKWQADIALNIQNDTEKWLDAYFVSSEWAQRPAGLTKSLLQKIFKNFTALAYDQYRQTPATWTRKRLYVLMTGIFIFTVKLSNEEFQLTIPAINALLGFVANHGWLSGSLVSTYQQNLTEIAPEMLKVAAKVNASGLVSEEDDLPFTFDDDDPLAMQDYLRHLNEESYDDFNNDSDEEVPFPDADNDPVLTQLRPISRNLKQLTRIGSLYDTDPRQSYLNDHLEQREKTHWQRKQAVAAHELGVAVGLGLWLNRDKFPVPAGMDAAEVTQDVSAFTDMLYNKFLVRPDQWNVTDFKQIGQWMRDTNFDGNPNVAIALFSSGIGYMESMNILTTAQSLQLPAALSGFSIPKRSELNKINAHGLSRKEARKLLKNNHHR